jgi:hypothetical protein
VRVEAVGDVVDRDPAAEVRVTAVMARVPFMALHGGGMAAGRTGPHKGGGAE